MPAIDLDLLIAKPGFAPRDWQSAAPDPIYGRKPAVTVSEDLRRILVLPRREPFDPHSVQAAALVEMLTERYGRGDRACQCHQILADAGYPSRPCITKLRFAQAWMLYELGLARGGLGFIGVGHGKTLIDLLAPMAMPGCQNALLLVPPGLIKQLVFDYRFAGEHFRMPSLVVHTGEPWVNIIPGTPRLNVLPYSRLSRPESAALVRAIAPDFIIADEAHKLRNADTATGARILRYVQENPTCRYAGWSGSLTETSVKDYAPQAGMALREGSPLPLDAEVAKEWATAIDSSHDPAPPGALLAFCQPGEHIHNGWRRRLHDTRGVIHTVESAIDAELSIKEKDAPPIPDVIEDMLGMVRNFQRPDGEELVDALSVAKCARELACGFFYRWIFPRREPVELIESWLDARKAWHKELRQKLKDRHEHLDSPLLCQRAAERAWSAEPYDGDLPVWRAETWPAWSEIRNQVNPETEAVRVDPYLAQDAADWAKANLGIVWYDHSAFGAWVSELSGLPMHGGGPEAGPRIMAERGDRSIVASIKAHGTGRDGLQRLFNTQLVGCPPSNANQWEQMLGRLHRIGQAAPVVYAWFYRHTPELQEHVDQALARALYIEGTTGGVQKLRVGFKG